MNMRHLGFFSTTALALVLSAGASAGKSVTSTDNRVRPPGLQTAANPCAAKKPGSPCQAKAKSCNPCGATNPCNPCLAAGVTTDCVIPRLAAAHLASNPCAAKKPCGACNPCAAKKACTPCNPCAAKKPCGACNPCAAKKACGACNPCAAKKKCGACNPCAAKKACAPCNPCAAKKACSPSNPCGPAAAGGPKEPPELSDAEAVAAYACGLPQMTRAYRKSGHAAAAAYGGWTRFSKISYPAEAHGVRFMNNYANPAAKAAYAKWEDAGAMPAGYVIAKDSFIVGEDGKISVGPLFLMSKQKVGWNKGSRDWLYTMIMAGGEVRTDKATQKFCNSCHRRAGAGDDYLMFLPLPFRISNPNEVKE